MLVMKIIVVAGGQGTKLWPYSREDRPKQFQTVIGEQSLYTQTINDLLKRFAPEDIFVSTKRKFIKYVSDQSPQIPLKNYIVEPDLAKDTGPGHGLAFLRLSVSFPGEPFFLVQADCIRKPEDAFLDMIEDAGKIVAKEKRLITGGIKAREPNMGADYLKLGEQLHVDSRQEVYEIKDFIYRGASYHDTKRLVESFHVVVHSNHYCWYPELMLEAYKKYQPKWHKALMSIRDVMDKPGEDAAIEKIYAKMDKGPTEEVTKHIMKDTRVILLPFKWTDIGTWGSVYEFFTDSDGTENYQDGKAVIVDSSGLLIKSSNKKKLVAVAGLQDLVIVDTDDALLIIPKHKIDKIKDIQQALADQDGKRYL